MKNLILVIATGALLTGCMLDARRPIGVGVGIGAAPAPMPVPVGGPPPLGPVYGAPAPLYQYYYYPSAGVYFNVATGAYFYMNGGAWQMGMSLPPNMVIDPGAYVSLQLNTDRPYLYYDQHRAQYMGWRGHEHEYEGEHGHGHGHWR